MRLRDFVEPVENGQHKVPLHQRSRLARCINIAVLRRLEFRVLRLQLVHQPVALGPLRVPRRQREQHWDYLIAAGAISPVGLAVLALQYKIDQQCCLSRTATAQDDESLCRTAENRWSIDNSPSAKYGQ